MFVVKVQTETVVYNTAKNKYEVSSVRKYEYSFKNQDEMIREMNKKDYEYKNNIYKNQSGWFRVTEVKSTCDNHPDHMNVSTGLIYSIRES